MRVDYMRIYVSSRVAADFATLPLRVVYRAGVGGGRLGANFFPSMFHRGYDRGSVDSV